ncbi:uncharacterized protein FOMMEDRAFT_166989 [Fomitiporia mediterranea MF3/22]|uniref:uncharacterized protein n=1 Tax=Fomitiporia mediterranea (strain MF3/22) TaxID=694068 RepID=UPI0004408C05|nr:uncharacterized protein FOMMEDRAFT_166989 [Fomitiporia mediterranea MF3/22]EJD03637.1 hypothetical protein FOMMEDRAFT_166989 [Fomitiporia mediterranea MF3/22]
MDTGSLIDAAITSLGHAQTVNYANAICVALVAYDFLLTFVDEVRLIWPAKWNVGKILFFLTRYPVFLDVALNLVDLIHPHLKLSLCKPIYQAAAWMSFTGITIAEIIMMMRVYAIWGAKREVLVFLVLFNLGIIIPDIILLQKSLRSLVFMPSPFPTLAPCVLIQADTSVYIDFILIMVSEFGTSNSYGIFLKNNATYVLSTVVIVMTFWKCFADWKGSRSPLMKTLFEDGLQYFISISLANLLVVKTANVDFSGLLFEIQRVLHAILSARMLIDIRDSVTPVVLSNARPMSFAAAPGKGSGGTSTLSQMEFGDREPTDSYNSSTTQVRSIGTVLSSFFKSWKAGPLSNVHITRGTIVDNELYHTMNVDSSLDNMDTDSLLNEAILSLNHAQVVNYMNVMCLALVAYDFLLTFADEVRLIWPAKWNMGKFMFFLTRYPVFLEIALTLVDYMQPNLKLNLCKPIYQTGAWMSLAGITVAEIIMMMRVYAIWGAKKEVLAFLVILNVGIIVSTIVILQKSLQSLVFIPSPFPTLAPCILTSADTTVYIDFVLVMVAEFVVIVMTVWKCFADWKENRSLLMKALFEDGLQYFICLFVVSLANLLVLKTAPVDFSGLLFVFQRVLHAILTARMLMHIRDAVEPITYSNLSAMSFAVRLKNMSSSKTLAKMEFGEPEVTNISGNGSSEIQIQSVETRKSIFKAGSLSAVHITRGTIADEELHQVVNIGHTQT